MTLHVARLRPARWSIRVRLTTTAMAAVVLAIGALAIGTGIAHRPSAVADLDAALTREAARLAVPATAFLDGDGSATVLRDAAARTGYLVSVAERGTVVLRTGRSLTARVPVPRAVGVATVLTGPLRWRTATIALPSTGAAPRLLQIAVSYLRLQRALLPTRQRAWLAGLVAVAVAGVAAWLFSGRVTDESAGALALARRFSADAGHELRTPLTSLRAGLGLLGRSDIDAGERAAIVRAADAEVTRLGVLVDRLQQLTAGPPAPADVERVDLIEVADEITVNARLRYPVAPIGLEAPATGACVLGSGDSLRTVLENLVENAVRHGGGSWLSIRAAGPGWLAIVVEDGGPGIPPGERAAVVGRFRRGSTAVGAGSGLGLALVAEHVRGWGGRLVIDDSPLGGARVTVLVPAG